MHFRCHLDHDDNNDDGADAAADDDGGCGGDDANGDDGADLGMRTGMSIRVGMIMSTSTVMTSRMW